MSRELGMFQSYREAAIAVIGVISLSAALVGIAVFAVRAIT